MIQRAIKPKEVVKTLKNGRIYYDPKEKSKVYWYNGITVCTKGRSITTVYRGKPKSRFIRIK